MTNNGIALIVIIILILIISLAVVGIALFVNYGTRLAVLKVNSEASVFLAQAGIYKGISDLEAGRFNGTSRVNLTENQFYSYGKQSNYLLVDPSGCYLLNYQFLKNIPIVNESALNTITVTQMIVEWDMTGNAELLRVYLGGRQQNTTPALPVKSGTLLTLTQPFIMTPASGYTGKDDNRWEFNDQIRLTNGKYNQALNITFIFSDGSRKKVMVIDKDFYTGNSDILITATGQVGPIQSPVMKRSIEATYDINKTPRVITSWQEVGEHIN